MKYLPEILPQEVFPQNIEDSSKIIRNKHQTDIGIGSVFSFLGGDIRKSPLSFNSAIGMFYDGLSPTIIVFILFYALLVGFDEFCIFIPLYYLSVLY